MGGTKMIVNMLFDTLIGGQVTYLVYRVTMPAPLIINKTSVN
ncbi:MAG: hypothetical protein JWR05_444 [Mucilaginibacter sp.]|nr:hypothetical protein [Mucilaginibacter sp.]